MNEEDFKSDIPLDQAIAAHNGSSFSPESRGQNQVNGYARELLQDFQTLLNAADTDEKRACLEEEFPRYREGIKRRTLSYLAARSRCISSMITGPANFPVRRAEKASNVAQKRLNELIEFRKRAMAAITKTLQPELRPIMAGDADALERLEEKLAAAVADQERMKAVNASIRKTAKQPTEFRIAALVALGLDETTAAKVLVRDCMGTIGYAPWAMTNNNATIKRMTERLAVLTAAKAKPATETKCEYATVEVDLPGNRVRLVFPGKPDEATRTRLKGGGFRWAPTNGAWQAYVNPRTRVLAFDIAGPPKEEAC